MLNRTAGMSRKFTWSRKGRIAALGIAMALSLSGMASAATVVGEWLVAEKTARVKISDCGGALWGIVSWEADPGIDTHNPDPAKRNQPITGLPVLRDLKPAGKNRWNGNLYNADNGKTYRGGVTLLDDNRLRVHGCVLFILCGGENWTRVEGDSTASDPEICARVASAQP
jgi:uncharacterized protein (DUF2147 family)